MAQSEQKYLHHTLIWIVPCSLFSLFYWIVASKGLASTQDSLKYIAAAKRFSESLDWNTLSSQEFIYWPPLFPIVLSVFPDQIETWVTVLHFFAGNAIIIGWVALSKDYIPSVKQRLLYGLCLASSLDLLLYAVHIWSEFIFLLLLTYSLYSLKKALEGNRDRHWIAFALLLFLLLLERNAGIFIWIGLIAGFLLERKRMRQTRLFKIVLSLTFGLSGFLAWNFHHLPFLGESLLSGETSFWGFRVLHTFNSLSLWILPQPLPAQFHIAIITILLIILFVRVSQHNSTIRILAVIFFIYESAWLFISFSIGDIARFTGIGLPIFFLLMLSDKLVKQRAKTAFYVGILWLCYPISRIAHQLWIHGLLTW